MNVNNRTGIPDLEKEIRRLKKENNDLMETIDADQTALHILSSENARLAALVASRSEVLENIAENKNPAYGMVAIARAELADHPAEVKA